MDLILGVNFPSPARPPARPPSIATDFPAFLSEDKAFPPLRATIVKFRQIILAKVNFAESLRESPIWSPPATFNNQLNLESHPVLNFLKRGISVFLITYGFLAQLVCRNHGAAVFSHTVF